MKDSWLLYDYLRRWWLLLLVGASLGAIIGLGYYSTQVHPVEYVVTANMVFEDPEYTGEGSPPKLKIAMESRGHATGQVAIERLRSAVSNLATATGTPVALRDLSIEQENTDEPWWKAVVLGSVLGTLMVIGGVYVLEDARKYLSRQKIGATNT